MAKAIYSRSHDYSRRSLGVMQTQALEVAFMRLLGGRIHDSKVIIELPHCLEVVPNDVLRICIREVMASDVDCLDFYTQLRCLTRVCTREFEQSGESLTEAECRLWVDARKGGVFWDIKDIFSSGEIDEIERHTEWYRNGPIIEAHYAERRRKANSALANRTLREQVFARHGEACLKCGDTSNLAIDHIVPVALGGTDDLDNLQVLCRSCNSSKGASLEEVL